MVPGEDDDIRSASENKPAFSFDNDTTMNLDGPGYALSLLLIGEIVILAMAFFAGGLGFGGRSFSGASGLSSWLVVFMIHLCTFDSLFMSFSSFRESQLLHLTLVTAMIFHGLLLSTPWLMIGTLGLGPVALVNTNLQPPHQRLLDD